MKDYIVTTTVNHFDATKFDFNKFYIVEGYGISHRCLLRKVNEDYAYFTAIVDGKDAPVVANADEVASGKVVIKEVADIPISNEIKEIFKYKDLYYNKYKIKTARCYELKIAGVIYKGFCSERNKDIITMVMYTGGCKIGVVHRDPTIAGEWRDDTKYVYFPGDTTVVENSITNGTIMIINLNEIKETIVYFRELV